MKEERDELEATIGQQTTETETLKKSAAEKLATVEAEIAELEETLRQKKAERNNIASSLAMHTDAITQVRAKFDRQLQRLSVREEAAALARKEWLVESDALNLERETLEEEKKKQTNAVTDHEQMLSRIDDETNEITQLKSIFKSLEDHQNDTTKDTNGGDDTASDDSAAIEASEKRVNAMSEQVSACESLHDSLSSEIRDINLQIPTLEQEKANAAKSRNFKVAASVSKELIAKKERLVAAETELSEEVEVELTKLRENETAAKNELTMLTKAASEKQKARILASVDEMVETIRKLKAYQPGKSSGWLLLNAEMAARELTLATVCKANGIDFGSFDLSAAEHFTGNQSDDLPTQFCRSRG